MISFSKAETNKVCISELNPVSLSLTFSDGNFKASGKPTKPCGGTGRESLVAEGQGDL